MTHNARYSAIIGDVIASRNTGNREDLQNTLVTAMTELNIEIPAVQPLTMTVGDEFQGLFADLSDAFNATLRLRLALDPKTEVRIGVGWGELTLVPTEPPFGQDGPCWWRARDAIEEVKLGESSNSVARSRRAVCRTGTSHDQILNSYLAARDHIVSGLDDVDRRLARLWYSGFNQSAMAKEVGLSQSSVSRRFQRHGLFALLDNQPKEIEIGVQ